MSDSPLPDTAFAHATELTDDAAVWTDVNDRIVYWNPAAERLYGWPAAEVLGQSILLTVPMALQDEEIDLRRRVGAGEVIRHRETLRRRANGENVPVMLSLGPCHSSNGEFTGIVTLARALSAQQESDREALHFAALVGSSDDAIVSKDLQGVVKSWNAAAERIFGYTEAEMIGASIRTIIPEDRQNEEDDTLAKIRRGDKVDHFETVRCSKGGALIPISLTVSPIRDAKGHIVGASKIARDIRKVKEVEAERLSLLHENVAIADQLNKVGTVVASGLDRDTILQSVTDAATELTAAQFGAFFYNVTNQTGESYSLYTISGVPREVFSKFPTPRNTASEPAFWGTVIRSDDITKDPRYGNDPPVFGMLAGHLPVRSYLAVPVLGRSGGVLGGLFFGHEAVGRFSARHEQLAVGVASWASVALQNAELYVTLQDASRLKDHFLATLSHELRTPLNAILGYARMLRSGMVAADKQHRAFQVIERNVTALTQIVDDVLDVSRIVSGKMRLNVQPIELSEILRSAVDAILPGADAKGVRVETQLDSRATTVSADPDRLQQIFWNLLSNAVKFTGRDGRIQVRLVQVDAQAEVSVSDSGIGIAPVFLPHVFERFRQADASITREHGGLGLGLAIARQLVELHGGTIDVASRGTGQGATFRVRIPLRVTRPSAAGNPRTRPQLATSPGLPDLSGLVVLAVDDDRDARVLVSEILEAAGARVLSAGSAAQALEVLGRDVPDVLLIDLAMPRVDGFELIERIRRHPVERVRELPAAALTAFARSEDRTRALNAGFHVHLGKPIDPSELTMTVAMLGKLLETNDP